MRLRYAPLCLALALPAAAIAAPVRDDDDSSGAVDIVEVQAAHNRTTDRLVHQIAADDAFGPRNLRTDEGPPGSICLNVWTTRSSRKEVPNYEVCVTASRDGKRYKSSIVRIGGRTVRRVGRARVEQADSKRLVIRFDPDRIRRPASYRWSAQSATFGAGCSSSTGCEDFAPDQPRALKTTLRTPR